MTKPKGYGYTHVKGVRCKHSGRHAKVYSKRISKRKQRYRGQGR